MLSKINFLCIFSYHSLKVSCGNAWNFFLKGYSNIFFLLNRTKSVKQDALLGLLEKLSCKYFLTAKKISYELNKNNFAYYS